MTTELTINDQIAAAINEAIVEERDALLTCLRNVMQHLHAVGGSPSEHAAFRAAFDELAKYGDPERERVRAWEEREQRMREVQL